MSSALVRSAKKSGKTIDRRSSREDDQVMKKKTRREQENVSETVLPHLPDTIIFEILVSYSARFVHSCRLVQKAWRDNIISKSEFIEQNFTYSKLQLILQCQRRTFYDVKLMNFKASKNICRLYDLELPRTGKIRPSCFGLFLVDFPKKPAGKILRVLNPVTKKHLTLPRFPSCCPHKACSAALVFDPSTYEFKVVHMYTFGAGFEIFTLGGDNQDNKWERVFLPWKTPSSCFSPIFGNFRGPWKDPVLIEGGRVLHWDICSCNYIISMNLVEEKVVATHLPRVGEGINEWKYVLLEMDGYLGAVYYGSKAGIEIWVLEDLETQVWYKRGSIKRLPTQDNSEYRKTPLFKSVPVGYVNGKDLLFEYHATDSDDRGLFLIVYDLNRREWTKKFKVNKKMKNMEPLINFRSSLLHWDTFKE